jgi:hypothetical protein
VRVHLNTGALNRPFDDLSAERVRLEAEAVGMIVAVIEGGRLELTSSDYLDFEVRQIPDPERAHRVRTILGLAASRVGIAPGVAERARSLEGVGLRGLDALHVAAAEAGDARLLITTDDRMLRRARRLGTDLAVRVLRPTEALDLIAEEEDSEGEGDP